MSDPVPKPPPISDRTARKLQNACIAIGMAAFAGVWALTGALDLVWRLVLAGLVASPILLLPKLLLDRSGPPPGFVPRKWEDDEEDR
jgi:hypothetical protein